MRIAAIIMALAVWWLPGAAAAQQVIAALDRHDKRIMQAALARAGYYDGLIDGAWGARSAASLAMAGQAETDMPDDEGAVAARLLHRYRAAWDSEGWAGVPLPALRMRFVAPFGLMTPVPGLADPAWSADDGRISVATHRDPAARMRARHEAVEAEALTGSEIYRVRRDALWITGAVLRGGYRHYMRSEPAGGTFETVAVRVRQGDEGLLMLTVGSVTTGALPPLDLPTGGPLAALMQRHPPTGDEGRALPHVTGIAAGPQAVLVAMAAIDGCMSLTGPDGGALTLAAADAPAGLALLRGDAGQGGHAAFALPVPPSLGQAVQLVGVSPAGEMTRLPAQVVAVRAGAFLAGDPGTLPSAVLTEGRFAVSGGQGEGTDGWVVTGAAGQVMGMVLPHPTGAPGGPLLATDTNDLLRLLIEAGEDFSVAGEEARAIASPVRRLRCEGGAGR